MVVRFINAKFTAVREMGLRTHICANIQLWLFILTAQIVQICNDDFVGATIGRPHSQRRVYGVLETGLRTHICANIQL